MSHDRFSPSALSRIEACPASIHGRHINVESEYSSEGTEFAEWCERVAKLVLEDNFRPVTELSTTYLGPTDLKALITLAPEEYRPYLTQYSEFIIDTLWSFTYVTQTYIEERIPNDQGFSGTPDCAVVGLDSGVTVGIVIDVKYGAGVLVHPKGNVQLLSYAALLLENHPEIKRFKLAIFQPRRDPTIEEIEYTRAEVKEFMLRRYDIKSKALANPDEFNDGPHCQFCPRVMDCPLKVEPVRELVKKVEDGVVTLTPDEIYRIAAMEDKVKEVFRDAKAIINAGLRDGSITPEECGFKLVDTLGHRKWSSQAEKELIEQYGDTVKKTSLLSPNQLETELRKSGLLDDEEKEIIAGLVERKKGIKMVPIEHSGDHQFASRDDF